MFLYEKYTHSKCTIYVCQKWFRNIGNLLILFVIGRILNYMMLSNLLYYIFILLAQDKTRLLAHNETTSNKGKRKTFNTDFSAQNVTIKLSGRLSRVGFLPLHSHLHKDVTFFLLFGKLPVSCSAYMKISLITFLLQVYALICKQTSIFHKPASFRE